MPNWCQNIVTFTHNDPEQIKKIEAGFKSDVGIFSTFFPIPEGYIESGAWYKWCNTHWGTKWDIRESDCNYIADYDSTDNFIRIFFDSAWSPPLEFYEGMVKLGFTVSAYYFEQGEGFVGSWTDGVDECFTNFSLDIDGIVPPHIIEAFDLHSWYDEDTTAE